MADESEESISPGADGREPLPPEPNEENTPVAVDGSAEEIEVGYPLPYMVVAIGASAGGVEAYIELFSSLTTNTGMAFVVIPHLMTDRTSHLVKILTRHTPMPLKEIEEGERPQPNHIYVLPPGAPARLREGVFRLEQREIDTVPRFIDHFFRSLAIDQKSRAAGVILSGTDSDGALGLKAIKGEGGITLVQSPESARFGEMPRTSIAVDHVDKILPPGLIATELASLGKQFHERRMLLHRLHTLAEYVGFLQGNTKELRELQEDALINVTRFFRDPAMFDSLKTTVLPRIFEDREPDQQIRIWVAGCSTGAAGFRAGRIARQFRRGSDAQFLHNPILVKLYSADRNIENSGDLLHRFSFGDQLQNLSLAGSKAASEQLARICG